MKITEIEVEEQRKFKPIIIRITIESLGEARLLNNIFKNNSLTATNSCDVSCADFIRKCVKKRGYNI